MPRGAVAGGKKAKKPSRTVAPNTDSENEYASELNAHTETEPEVESGTESEPETKVVIKKTKAKTKAKEDTSDESGHETVDIDVIMNDFKHKLDSSKKSIAETFNELFSQFKELQKEYIKYSKMVKKQTRKSKKREKTTKTVEQKLRPVYTNEMKEFIENNTHLEASEKKGGNLIYPEPKYDDDGNILFNNGLAMQLISAYIRVHNLQYDDQPKRIHIDNNLKKIFPNLVEQKDKSGKVIKEENCYFTTIMGEISKHFKKSE